MILFERHRHTNPPPSVPASPHHGQTLTHTYPGGTDTLHFRTDARCTLVRGPDWWLYVTTPVGLECFPALTGLLAQAPALGLDAVLEKLESIRPLAFVAHCQRRNALTFGRSFDGFAALYFGTTADRLLICHDRTEVARRLGPVRLSRHDEQTWCERRTLDPEGSFYENVTRCFAGVRYHVPARQLIAAERRFLAPTPRPAIHPNPVALLSDGLREIFSSYGNRKVALRLSGGVDSRTLLVGLIDAVRQGILRKDQILCTSVLFPGFNCDESPAIRRLIDVSGFEWAPVAATRENVDRAQQRCLRLPAPPFPTSFMGALCAEAASRHGASILLSGHGGDELFQFDLVDVLGNPLVERLRRLDLIRGLRQSSGGKDEIKTWLMAILGRHCLRSLGRSLKVSQLPDNSLATHRLSRRLSLAKGCGYELATLVAADSRLFTDIPLLRGPFFQTMDPSRPFQSRTYPDKDIAHNYMKTLSPAADAIESRKATFDAFAADCLQRQNQMCDAVDSQQARIYPTGWGYLDWRACLQNEASSQ